MKNPKRKGTRNEHRSRKILEAAGYTILRAAGSLGAFDLAGFSRGGIVLVQVKSNRWPSPGELELLRDFPGPAGTTKLVHRWDDRQKLPRIKEL